MGCRETASRGRHRLKSFERSLEVVAYVEELAKRHSKTPAQVALNWVINQPGITSPIVGAKRPSQLKENLGAIGWRLSREESDELGGRGAEVPRTLDFDTNMWGYKPS